MPRDTSKVACVLFSAPAIALLLGSATLAQDFAPNYVYCSSCGPLSKQSFGYYTTRWSDWQGDLHLRPAPAQPVVRSRPSAPAASSEDELVPAPREVPKDDKQPETTKGLGMVRPAGYLPAANYRDASPGPGPALPGMAPSAAEADALQRYRRSLPLEIQPAGGGRLAPAGSRPAPYLKAPVPNNLAGHMGGGPG
jgi:hypothetical protein